ncbi:MAG TPA: hypothetical protein DCZ01_08085 [Elusimicrobia bacterium]|nr:MAG: hypothetical protein A2X37_09400 [Elusimicrobia bacterium GWA2_66_18]HAZ08463.1 hypothetical protein [Elusimicrobiota bacterium]
MIRHRRRCQRVIASISLAAVVTAASFLFAAAARAQSVQVYINSAFVARSEFCRVTSETPPRYLCPLVNQPKDGNISNDPEIQFETDADNRCRTSGPFVVGVSSLNVCNSVVHLCAQVGITNNTSGTVSIDEVNFELFKFQDGSNPLDSASTPPIRTFFIDAPGTASGVSSKLPNDTEAYCVLWDGTYNIQGEFGKTNGQYGFRATVKTNQQGDSGNIVITQTRAYPSGATRDSNDQDVSQKPITVDVTNVHVIRSTPTVVGQVTGVSAQPYGLTYRLSKDASMYITINEALPGAGGNYANLRTVLNGLPRSGEGTPQGTLLNGDSWDGRDNFANILPAGNYLAVFQAVTSDQYGQTPDLSFATTRQIALDPLQITDIRVQPLLGGATSLAVLSYMLTEAATVYIDVFPPGTQFCAGLNSVNDPNLDPSVTGQATAKSFTPRMDSCSGAAVSPLRTIAEQKASRSSVISFWDGRDASGTLVNDGDYVFVMYASLVSQLGQSYSGNPNDKRIWTSSAKAGFLSVLRGLCGITQISPTSTVIGSSPAISGLNPFTFRYQLSRDCNVSMKIYDATGTRLVKTLVNQETRPGLFNNSEAWTDGTDDSGQVVSSGTYLAQLTAADPSFPAKVSTTTALFPVHLMRITDVSMTPLLSGTSDQVVLNYQLSQPMFVAWNIYPAGSYIASSTLTWPPCAAQSPPNSCTSASVLTSGGGQASPIVTFHGLRPGRLRISEFWDGRDASGLFVPDGSYVYTLTAQSTTTPKYFAADRVYGNVTVARGGIIFTSFNVSPDVPQLFNSSNTITLHPYTITYALTRQSSVTVQILNTQLPPQVVRTVVSGAVRQGGILLTDVWDGRDDTGNFPPTGFYLVRAVADDVASLLSSGSTAQLTISYDPLRIYDLAVTPLRSAPGSAALSYQVSETMKVAIKIYKPGTAFDSSGNPSPPDSVSLVRRIVGVRPARTPIVDEWDGRDFRLSLVPDGNYKFKIVGSTDLAAIDDITGDVNNPGALSLDRLVDEIPVAVNASADPKADFEQNTFAYPNPITGPSATFQIHAPFRAKVQLKLHNIAGELVLDKNFGEVAAAYQAGPLTYVWNKINQGGHEVARGLYYAVIRVEEAEGGRSVLQTVKKVLVP